MMAKDIYLLMKQYALLSPRLSRGEAEKSSSKPDRSESDKKHEEDVGETKVAPLAQSADPLV